MDLKKVPKELVANFARGLDGVNSDFVDMEAAIDDFTAFINSLPDPFEETDA